MNDGKNTTSNAPDCWCGYGQIMSAVNSCVSLEELRENTKQLGETAAVEACGNLLRQCDKAYERLVHVVQEHPDKPETILAARYLANMEYAPGLVLPFCAYVLHQILFAGKLAQMKDVAVDVIQSIAFYGELGAPYALDVVGCLLLTACPAEVKDAAMDFLIAVASPNICNGAFLKTVAQSNDPVIRQWEVERYQDGEGERDDEENPPRWVVDEERSGENHDPIELG